MNQSTFQLLGNVASADFYLCEGSDITLISDNNAYNMKALAQEALKLRVPNSLTIIDLNNFYVGMIPIDHNQILTMIPHINTGTIPCQVDTYKNENTVFLIRPNGTVPCQGNT